MRATLLLLLLLVASAFYAPLIADDVSRTAPGFTCGLNAAYLFLNKTGHHAAYAELLRDFENEKVPDSLLAIRNVLDRHGCRTVGIKTDADYFLQRHGPAIVHLQLLDFGPAAETHFSCLAGASSQDGVQLLDPVFNAKNVSCLSWDTFCARFRNGAGIEMKGMRAWSKVIAWATLPLILGAGCSRKDSIKMETELEMKKLIDLGVILDTTQPILLAIPIKNVATRTLTISRLSKDCSCTSVSMDKSVLKPGESATLRVSTNLSGKTNLYVGSVVIESDAVERLDEIEIRGQITGQIRIRPQQTTVVLGEKTEPGIFTVYCEDQTGVWQYKGFQADDPRIKVELTHKSSSPTTSAYDGVVSIAQAEGAKATPDYLMAFVKLQFHNAHLGRDLDLNYPVALVTRRKMTVDPPQVMFGHELENQRRTVLVQGAVPIEIDTAVCDLPCVRPTLRRVDPKTFAIDLVFSPVLNEDLSLPIACKLQTGGKTVATIPINFVNLH